LKVCFKGSAKEVQDLKEATETATNTTITLDGGNCIKKAVRNDDRPAYSELQAKLFHLIAEPKLYSVEFDTAGRSYSAYNPTTRAAYIVRASVGTDWYWNDTPILCRMTGSGLKSARYDLPALVTHELLGHGSGGGQMSAIDVENVYHDAVGQLRRCRYER
jgi:hypothetical protein